MGQGGPWGAPGAAHTQHPTPKQSQEGVGDKKRSCLVGKFGRGSSKLEEPLEKAAWWAQ